MTHRFRPVATGFIAVLAARIARVCTTAIKE